MGYILISCYIVIILYAMLLGTAKELKLLIFICFFQNFGLVLVSRFINYIQFNIIILIKEIYVAMLFAKLLIQKRKISKDIIFCIITIFLLVMLMLAHGNGNIMGQLTSLRQLYLPFMFFAIGRLSGLNNEDLKNISIYYIKLCLFAMIFGIIDLIFGERLWLSLGISRYLDLKGVEDFILPNGMLRSFYTFDLGLGFRVRRMASVLVDPVILGQLFAFGFIISAFSKELYHTKGRKLFYTGMLGVGLLLTLAKGGLVIALVSYCILIGNISKKKIYSRLLFIIVCIVFVTYFGFALREELSLSNHYNGLISGIATLKSDIFGTGIGSAGNHAQSFGSDSRMYVSGDESYIGSMLAQTGVIGLFLNLVMFIYTVEKHNYNSKIQYDVAETVRILMLSLFATSLVNYTAISFTSCFIYFIYSGATKRVKSINYNLAE